MANHRYSANHGVGPDMARPSPGSGSGSKGTVKEGSANWPRNIGPAGPAINKTGFKEVKAYPVSRMNDDPVDPSIYQGAAMTTTGMVPPQEPMMPSIGNGISRPNLPVSTGTLPPDLSAISPMEMNPISRREMRQNRRQQRRASRIF
jgi:hypothetical protein